MVGKLLLTKFHSNIGMFKIIMSLLMKCFMYKMKSNIGTHLLDI